MSKKKNTIKKSYYLAGQVLESANQTKDLGVLVTTDLSWNTHIEYMCAKTNKLLGLVKRVCCHIRDPATRHVQLLYCTLVRPRLEYASNLWSPHTAKHVALIENIQRRATKFILNYPPSDVSYTERLKTLNLLPLEHRREINDLTLLYKIRTEIISVNFSNLLIPTTSRYSTRNFDPANYRPLLHHKQNYYRKSYFPRAIALWNGLPTNFKNINNLLSRIYSKVSTQIN